MLGGWDGEGLLESVEGLSENGKGWSNQPAYVLTQPRYRFSLLISGLRYAICDMTFQALCYSYNSWGGDYWGLSNYKVQPFSYPSLPLPSLVHIALQLYQGISFLFQNRGAVAQ